MNAVEAMERECAKFRLHVLWAKKTVQNLGADHPCAVKQLTGRTSTPCPNSRILAKNLSSMIIQCQNVSWQIALASRVMSNLDDVWQQQNLSLTTKLCVNSASVMSVLLYDAETWTLSERERLKVQLSASYPHCQVARRHH